MFKKKPSVVENHDPNTLQNVERHVFAEGVAQKVDKPQPRYFGKPQFHPDNFNDESYR